MAGDSLGSGGNPNVNNASAISIEHVGKTFARQGGGEVVAVENVNISISEGEFVCLVGPSGCGKSTLMKLVAGLTRATNGAIRFHNEEIVSPRRDIGIVFQAPILLPWRSALENVLLPIQIYGLSREKALRRAHELFDLVGLKGFEGSYPHELSGGMQQRVAIARALIHDPGMLLMDEPFGALDAMTRQIMNLELTRIWSAQKKTVLLITHDIGEAIFLADRVLVMSARPGTIVETIEIDLPRPRRLSVVGDVKFGAYVRQIQQLLGLDELVEAYA